MNEKKTVTIANSDYAVCVALCGAELVSFKSITGKEYIWCGDKKIWARHAPILFPMIGKFNHGEFSFSGETYAMSQHGFARDMDFAVESVSDDSVTLRLESSELTRVLFPFDFLLTVHYRLRGSELSVDIRARNIGISVLPIALGAHPAFAIPESEIEHTTLTFSDTESALCKKVSDGLLTDTFFSSPIERSVFSITEGTFLDDAFVLPAVKSSSVLLETPSRALTIAWSENTTHLGLWSKPGAPFICIEPWVGSPDDVHSPVDIFGKAALTHIVQDDSLELSWSVRVH